MKPKARMDNVPSGLSREVKILTAAAVDGVNRAWSSRGKALGESAGMGADGTPTLEIDRIVEDSILDTLGAVNINLLSEESGFIDVGSAITAVVDPVDGSSNAASGIPLSCFSLTLVRDDMPVEALTMWFETGVCWAANEDSVWAQGVSNVRSLSTASVNLLRPKEVQANDNFEKWSNLVRASRRIHILSSSCLEAMLVADGAIDAFCDVGSDTHRIMDIAAASLIVPKAGGVVRDIYGRPINFAPDLSRRWSMVAASTSDLADEICALINDSEVKM